MADAQHLDNAVETADETRGSAPFGLVLVVAMAAGIIGGLYLCDVLTRPSETPQPAQQLSVR
ncbi:MAG: hypothetical protein AAFY60_00330 [Myxococcota bacterium]